MLPCPTCGANIDARNDALAIAACGQCGGLFEWPALPLEAPSIIRPRRVKVERRDGKVHAIRWRSNPVPLLVGALLVAGTLSLVSTLWAVTLAPLWVAIVVGVLLWYRGPVGIQIGPVISVRNGIARRRRFAAASIRQPFVRRRYGNSYALCATQADGTVVSLAEGFALRAEAQYIERELEAALGIEDAPVPGDARTAPALADSAAPLRSLRLVCPACATAVTASDLQLGKGQAICPGCRKGMLLGGPVATGARTIVILPPPRATVDRSDGAFALEARLGTGLDPVVTVGLPALWVGLQVYASYETLTSEVWLGFVVLSALMALLSNARSGHRVRIRVENDVLRVRIGPLPLGVPQAIPITEIAQVFVRARPRSRFLPHGNAASGGYQLCVVDRSGRVTPLVKRMMDLSEARYLEEQLEQHLGIDDAPVAGEIEGKRVGHQVGAPSLPGSGNLSLPDASAGGELSVPRAAGALSEPD